MKHESDIYFQRALSYLDDIQRLCEANVSPLIRQAIYNFHQADHARQRDQSLLGEFPQMLFFWKSFTENLKQRLMDRHGLENVNFSLNDKELSLTQVESLSGILPSYFDVLCNLSFEQEVHIQLKEKEITTHGKMRMTNELENKRVEIYRLTRWFLKKGMILTFSLKQVEGEFAQIELNLNLTDQVDQIMLLDLGKNETPLVGFSSVLADYRVSYEYASRLGRHLCIEITEDLNVEKYYRLPKRVCNEKSHTEIMHFAFLFRPVSFIIPRAGRLANVSDLLMLEGTGRGIKTAQQEVEESNRSYFFIDILSLMSC